MAMPPPEKPENASTKSADLQARVRRAAALKFTSNCTDAQLAQLCGISVHTVADWKHRPEWRSEIKSIADRQLAETYHELSAMAPFARQVIQDILREGPPALRLKAAQAVCELPLRAVLGAK